MIIVITVATTSLLAILIILFYEFVRVKNARTCPEIVTTTPPPLPPQPTLPPLPPLPTMPPPLPSPLPDIKSFSGALSAIVSDYICSSLTDLSEDEFCKVLKDYLDQYTRIGFYGSGNDCDAITYHPCNTPVDGLQKVASCMVGQPLVPRWTIQYMSEREVAVLEKFYLEALKFIRVGVCTDKAIEESKIRTLYRLLKEHFCSA